MSEQVRELALKEKYDLIVVGGGCNGLAIAWDASLRGLSVLLLEKDDFGWATSAWNSRLIHGGLKYLEKYDVPLVRESLREREWLLKAAPHLVAPLRFYLPFYRQDTHKPWLLRAGMLAYDILSADKSTPWHRLFSKTSFVRSNPAVNQSELCGGASYFETQIAEPERLMVELSMAAREAGADVHNHAEVTGMITDQGQVKGVRFLDRLSGASHEAAAPVVVNAAGPWVDEVLNVLHAAGPRKLMGGTKGTHLVIAHFPGAPKEAMYYEAKSDSRPLLVIPWRGRYLLGSTDERFEGTLDSATPSADEISYILNETNRLIPEANLNRGDVLWCYAGIRPLPFQEEGPTSDITRRHMVVDHAPEIRGLLSIVGGKLTTFRSLGKDTVDAVFNALGQRAPRFNTRKLRMPGGFEGDPQLFVSAFQTESTLDPAIARRLANRYGTRARDVERLAHSSPLLAQEVPGTAGILAAEVVYAVRVEQAGTIGDVAARRIMTGLDDDLGVESIRAVGAVLIEHCGWTADRVETEVNDYLEYIHKLQPRNVKTP